MLTARSGSWLLGGIMVAGAIVSSTAQPTPVVAPGGNAAAVIVTKVVGAAWIESEGTKHAAAHGQAIRAGAAVSTGENASLAMAFSNAASLLLGPNTTVTLEKFHQDPFAQTVNMSTAVREPSVSHLRLKLVRGEIEGVVRILRRDLGSYFQIDSPAGRIEPLADQESRFRARIQAPSASRGPLLFVASADVGELRLAQEGELEPVRIPPGHEVKLEVEVAARPDGKRAGESPAPGSARK